MQLRRLGLARNQSGKRPSRHGQDSTDGIGRRRNGHSNAARIKAERWSELVILSSSQSARHHALVFLAATACELGRTLTCAGSAIAGSALVRDGLTSRWVSSTCPTNAPRQ